MPQQPPDELEAALADHYHIERELGRGGMATVYLARDLRHERLVALKVLRPDVGAALGRERFSREIKLAAGLQHPHIVSVHDSGSTPSGQLWFTMPYVEGLSLRDRLRQQRQLSVDESVRITREVALALDYAHRHGVIHRDVKPENILLVDGQPLVADFGIARAIEAAAPGERLTATGIAVGTPAYMSPEQAAGERALDPATDIYSLGAVCYEMLTGEPPFPGPTAQAIAAKMRSGEVPSIRRVRPSVSEAVEEAVRKALAPVPADRYASAGDLAKALEAAERTGLVSGSRVVAARIKRPWPALVAASSMALVAVVAAALTWHTGAKASTKPGSPVRIAVLPFENLGAADDDYFADGMTEELTSRLAKMSGLAVMARTSAMQYKKTAKAIPAIGRELGVDYLIEGSVRWEKQPPGAGRVRITPQLVRARDGTHVWADEYDKAYGTEIFDLQSDIAERVANALSITLLASEQKAVRAVPTKNLQAYDSFLRGQGYTARDLGQDWELQRLALESYRQAVELDSTFALAYAAAASTQWYMYCCGYDISRPDGLPSTQRLELAREDADRALGLDPDISAARVVLARYYLEAKGDTARALGELEKAVRVDSSDADVVSARGEALFALGSACSPVANESEACTQRGDGLHELERAVALDPRNPHRLLLATWRLGMAGQGRAAEAYADQAIAIFPDLPAPYTWKALQEVMQGHVQGARDAIRQGFREAGASRVLFAVAQDAYTTRLIRILSADYGDAVKQLSWDAFGTDSLDYYDAKAQAYRTDAARGSAYCDSLAAWAKPRAERAGENAPDYAIVLATGLAGAGHRDLAARQIDGVLRDKRYVWNPIRRESMAEACVLANLKDCAIEQIRLALADPIALSPGLLQADPIWAPLRGRADFQQILNQR